MSSTTRSPSDMIDDEQTQRRTRRTARGGEKETRRREATAPQASDKHGGTQVLPPSYTSSDRSDVYNITPLDTSAEEHASSPEKRIDGKPGQAASNAIVINDDTPPAHPAADHGLVDQERASIAASAGNGTADLGIAEPILRHSATSDDPDTLRSVIYHADRMLRAQHAEKERLRQSVAEESARYWRCTNLVDYYRNSAMEQRDRAASFEEALADQEERNKALHLANADMKRASAEANEEKDRLRDELREAKQGTATSRTDLEQQLQSTSAQVTEIAQLTLERDEANIKASDLEQRIQELEQAKGQLAIEHAEATSKISELEQQIKDFEEEVRTFDQKLADRDAAVEAVTSVNPDAKLVIKYRTEAEASKKKADGAKAETAERKTRYEANLQIWCDQRRRLEEEVGGLKKVVSNDTAMTIAELVDEKVKLQQELSKTYKKLAQAKENLNQNMISTQSVGVENDELKQELAVARGQVS